MRRPRPPRRGLPRRGRAGVEHLPDLDLPPRRRHRPAGPRDRQPLVQPAPRDGPDRGRPRRRDLRRDPGDRPRPGRALRQGDDRLPQGRPGLRHLAPDRDPHGRGGPDRRGGHRRRRGGQPRLRPGLQPRDGPARHRRPERPGHPSSGWPTAWPSTTATASWSRRACGPWSTPVTSAARPGGASATTARPGRRTSGASGRRPGCRRRAAPAPPWGRSARPRACG